MFVTYEDLVRILSEALPGYVLVCAEVVPQATGSNKEFGKVLNFKMVVRSTP